MHVSSNGRVKRRIRSTVVRCAAAVSIAIGILVVAGSLGLAASPAVPVDEPPRASGFPRDPVGIANAMGKPFVAAFLIASVLAVWFAIERLVVLRRARVIPRPFVDRFLEHLEQGRIDRAEALQLCEDNGSPVAHTFAHGIRKWGKPSVEVEQAIIDGGERQVSLLRKHLRVLNGVATITPLIGLLGTVIGMIQSFIAIESSAVSTPGSDEKLQLAVGIAMALMTTAAGLAIAIPALILYLYLAGRVDALVMDMDELGQSVVHLVSAEGLQEAAQSPRVPMPKSLGTAGGGEGKMAAKTGKA